LPAKEKVMPVETKKVRLADYVRALRLPFVTASVLPFIYGSLLFWPRFNFPNFLLGLISVLATHIGANLINDYADSLFGVDWLDKNFYGFFGGSKLIQEGRFSERKYLWLFLSSFGVGFLAVGLLAVKIGSWFPFLVYLFIGFLGFSYSHKLLRFSYRYLGGLVIFVLFGPATVLRAHYGDKEKLLLSSRLTIQLQSFMGVLLILGAFL
jgi:1,4-dihydroxy-2-naphthoate octaprenyltransferase